MSKNDEKILQLKKQIEEKKSQLNKDKKFTPATNCSINLGGSQININTLQREGLISLLVNLNSLKLSATDLGIVDELAISGYNVCAWIDDVKNKLDIVSIREEEAKLRTMELRLGQLLSEDKRVELELEQIMKDI